MSEETPGVPLPPDSGSDWPPKPELGESLLDADELSRGMKESSKWPGEFEFENQSEGHKERLERELRDQLEKKELQELKDEEAAYRVKDEEEIIRDEEELRTVDGLLVRVKPSELARVRNEVLIEKIEAEKRKVDVSAEVTPIDAEAALPPESETPLPLEDLAVESKVKERVKSEPKGKPEKSGPKIKSEEDLKKAFKEAEDQLQRGDYEDQEQYQLALFESMKEQGLLESMGPEFSAGLKMYREQRIEQQREISLDPVGFVRETALGLMVSGETDFRIAAGAAMSSLEPSHEQGWLLEAIVKMGQLPDQIKTAGDEKQAWGMVGFPKPENMIGVQDFNVPLTLEIDDDGEKKKLEGDIGITDAQDLIFRNGDYRRKLFGHNAKSRRDAQLSFPAALTKYVYRDLGGSIVGVEFTDIDERKDAQSYDRRVVAGLAVELPEGSDDQEQAELKYTREQLKSMRESLEARDRAHLLSMDGNKIDSAERFYPWLGAWTLKGAEMTFLPFGGIVDLYPSVTEGRYPYWFRKGLDGDGYAEGYHLGMWMFRKDLRTNYGSLLAENWLKILPITGLGKLDPDSPLYEKLGLEGVGDEDDVEEAIWGSKGKEAADLMKYILVDAPLKSWLKPYEKQIFEGKKVIFDVAYTPVVLPRNDKDLEVEFKGDKVEVNFDNAYTARVFVQNNRAIRGRARTFDQMEEVFESLDGKAKDLFSEANMSLPLRAMGVEDVDGVAYKGVKGVREAIGKLSFKDVLWENLSEYDMWKWWYYYVSSKSTYDAVDQVFKSSLIASKMEGEGDDERVARAEKELGELLGAFSELSSQMAWASITERTEKLMEILVAIVNNCAPHNDHLRYEYVKQGEDSLLVKYGDYEAKDLDARQKSLGFRVFGKGFKSRLLATGGHTVYKSKVESQSFPTAEQYGAVPVTIGALEQMVKMSGHDKGQTNVGVTDDYLAKAVKRKLLPENVDTTAGEKFMRVFR